jgi:hypothetical protein
LLFTAGLHAAPNQPITNAEKVQFKNKKVYASIDGGLVAVTNQVALPFNILIDTNGMFTVDGGGMRALQDGDILSRDGMLLRPDGSISPVMDHITMNRGQVLRADDGEAAAPHAALQLGDGTVIQPDRKVVSPDGSPRWLQDGELLRPGGGTFPARDTVTMQNGQVVVQKDGAKIPVGAGRSIMMNNGTKVLGDGTLISFDGGLRTVSEGEIIALEGIIVRKP